MPQTVGAPEAKKTEAQKKQDTVVDLYIGVFFDGTNNNHVQSMIGTYFRRKNIFNKNKDKFKRQGIKDLQQLIDKGITRQQCLEYGLNDSDCDALFGSADKIDLTLEKSIMSSRDDENRWSSPVTALSEKAEDVKGDQQKYKNSRIYNKLNEGIASNKESTLKTLFTWASDIEMKGSMSQGASYTNPTILNSIYKTSKTSEQKEDKTLITRHMSLYVEGSGADQMTLLKDNLNPKNKISCIIGLGFGVGSTGVAAKCRIMSQRINQIIEGYNTQPDVKEIRVYFDVFGFSRGAATARVFTYLVNLQDIITNNQEKQRLEYELFSGSKKPFLPLMTDKQSNKGGTESKLKSKEVRSLGIYDTVASIGILRDGLNDMVYELGGLDKYAEFSEYRKSQYHDRNVDCFGLYASEKAKNVLHICALDENRINFSLTDIENSLGNGTEIFIPGCHTDIGAGCSFGLDNLKIVNTQIVENSGDIASQWLNVLHLLKGTIKFASNITSAAANISATISSFGTGAGIIVGLKTFSDSLNDITEAVYSLNMAAHGLHSLLYDTRKYLHDNGTDPYSPEYREMIHRRSDIKEIQDNYILHLKQQLKDLYDTGSGLTEKTVKESELAANLTTINFSNKSEGNVIGLANFSFGVVKNILSALTNLKSIINSIKSASKQWKAITDDWGNRAELANHKTAIKQISEIIDKEVEKIMHTISTTENTCYILMNKNGDKRRQSVFVAREVRDVLLSNDYPFTKEKGLKAQNGKITVRRLKDLGWVPENASIYKNQTWFTGRARKEDIAKGETIVLEDTHSFGFFKNSNVGLYKYSTPGYCNIPLKMVWYWCTNSIDNDMFSAYPEASFPIPEDLSSLSQKCNEQTLKKGRYFCVPATMEQYRTLRSKYLHFSLNNQLLALADNQLVNGPSLKYEHGTDAESNIAYVSRRIYSGTTPSQSVLDNSYVEQRSVSLKHMADYNPGNGQVIKVNLNIKPNKDMEAKPQYKISKKKTDEFESRIRSLLCDGISDDFGSILGIDYDFLGTQPTLA